MKKDEFFLVVLLIFSWVLPFMIDYIIFKAQIPLLLSVDVTWYPTDYTWATSVGFTLLFSIALILPPIYNKVSKANPQLITKNSSPSSRDLVSQPVSKGIVNCPSYGEMILPEYFQEVAPFIEFCPYCNDLLKK